MNMLQLLQLAVNNLSDNFKLQLITLPSNDPNLFIFSWHC